MAKEADVSDRNRVVVVTDSTSNIPDNLREGLPIKIVPVIITIGDRTYLDEVELPTETFYQWLRADPALSVATSCPAPGEFLAAYKASASEGFSGIVSVHISSILSGIFHSASQGAEVFRSRGIPIELVDSGTVSMALGFCVLEAARVAAAGGDAAAAAEAARRVACKVKMFAVVKTLGRVASSGRVPQIVRYVLAKMPVYPVLAVGEWRRPRLVRPERTYRRALQHMMDLASREIDSWGLSAERVNLAVMHADAQEEADRVASVLAGRHGLSSVVMTQFTPVMGGHTGAGLVGVAYYPSEDSSGP